MKITAVQGYPVKVGHRNQFVVKVWTDEGLTCGGEGGISGRELAKLGPMHQGLVVSPLIASVPTQPVG